MTETKVIKIQVPVSIPTEDVCSMIINAVEGGSNYWGRISIIDANGKKHGGLAKFPLDFIGHLKLVIEEFGDESEPFATHEIDLMGDQAVETVQKALLLMAEKQPRHFQELLEQGDDVETADVFLQLAAMGEVKYG